MTSYKYLIVGGGMAAGAALNGIREIDHDGSIGVISQDVHLPYDRPPLSKALWTGQKTEDDISCSVPVDVTFHLGRQARLLDPASKQVTDNTGEVFAFEKVLLATGGSPRRVDLGDGDIIYFRTLDDYHHLRELQNTHERFAVIGGGFIGSEIAAALAMQGKQVHLIFPDAGIGARLFPADLSAFLNTYYTEKGVHILAGTTVKSVSRSEGALKVTTADNRSIIVDGVVAGAGILPNTQIAEAAGLEVSNGIVVDSHFRSSHPDIYAAGDVANYYDAVLRTRRRVEHEDAALKMGQAAGRSMAGQDTPYESTPMFYSDLFDLGYEAVGVVDARLTSRSDWDEQFKRGTIYYSADGQIRGILNWNVWGKLDEARSLLGASENSSLSR